MRIRYLTAGLLLCMQPLQADATTLEQAMETATRQHPLLQIAGQDIAIAEANLSERGSYAYNPELTVEPQRRRLNGGGKSNDYYITLSQGIETGGKRGLREAAAQAALDAAAKDKLSTRQQLSIEAARAFVSLYVADRKLALRQQQSALLEKVNHAIARKLETGEASLLDASLAESIFASAVNETATSRQLYAESLRRYLQTLGINDAGQLELPVELPVLSETWQPPAIPYQTALESRPDIAALDARIGQSNAIAELAGSSRIPDITLSAMSGRETGDQLIKLGITIPFPVLNSHQGAYRAALAEKERMRAGLVWSKQKLRLEVQNALSVHGYVMQTLHRMNPAAIDAMAQNSIALAQKAYDAGELDLESLVVRVRQGLDARLTSLGTLEQAWLARIRVAEVLGHPEYILEGLKP